jgi:hypothetical protein
MQSYIKLAPDSTGKQVVMEQITLLDGTTAYRQVAEFGGITGEQFDELLRLSRSQLAVLRAILASLNSTNSTVTEDDFTGRDI